LLFVDEAQTLKVRAVTLELGNYGVADHVAHEHSCWEFLVDFNCKLVVLAEIKNEWNRLSLLPLDKMLWNLVLLEVIEDIAVLGENNQLGLVSCQALHLDDGAIIVEYSVSLSNLGAKEVDNLDLPVAWADIAYVFVVFGDCYTRELLLGLLFFKADLLLAKASALDSSQALHVAVRAMVKDLQLVLLSVNLQKEFGVVGYFVLH
jgi:hypothetical protein